MKIYKQKLIINGVCGEVVWIPPWEILRKWRKDYNNIRPHSELVNMSPPEFAKKMKLEKHAA